jgi:Mor family transcriptional regulator
MTKNNYKQEVLTLETHVKVISDSETGMSQRCLAKKYNCGKTQIQQILN